MTITFNPVNHGTVAGDETGEIAFEAFQKVNLADAALKAGVEELQGRFWTLDNAARTLALGERIVSETHAGIVHTLPATFAVSATAYGDIWVWNTDADSDVTLTPASGDQLFVKGVGLGIDATQPVTTGDLVIISPRVTNASWNVLIVGAGTVNMLTISDTKANFNISLNDGDFMFIGDAPTAHNHTTATAGFTVTGAITATGDITAFFSDDRLKIKLGNIYGAVDLVNRLNGFYYKGNKIAKSFGYDDSETLVGVSAQEVAKIIPSAVKPAPFDLDEEGNSKSGENYKTVQYEKLIPLLIEAVKELSARIECLELGG